MPGLQTVWLPEMARPFESLWSMTARFLRLERPTSDEFQRFCGWATSTRHSLAYHPARAEQIDRWAQSVTPLRLLLRLPKRQLLTALLPTHAPEPYLDMLRYCQECAKSAFHSSVYQWIGLSHCPFHHIPLSNACPDCGATWSANWSPRFFLAAYRCGRCQRDLLQGRTQLISSEEVVPRQLLRALHDRATKCLRSPVAIYRRHDLPALTAQAAQTVVCISPAAATLSYELHASGQAEYWPPSDRQISTVRIDTVGLLRRFQQRLERRLFTGMPNTTRNHVKSLTRPWHVPQFAPVQPLSGPFQIALYAYFFFRLTVVPDGAIRPRPHAHGSNVAFPYAGQSEIEKRLFRSLPCVVAALPTTVREWVASHIFLCYLDWLFEESRIAAQVYADEAISPSAAFSPVKGLLIPQMVIAVMPTPAQIQLYLHDQPDRAQVKDMIRDEALERAGKHSQLETTVRNLRTKH